MIVGGIIKSHNDFEHWQVIWYWHMSPGGMTSVTSMTTLKIVFWISSAVYALGAVTFILIGSAVEQSWNRSNKLAQESDKKTTTKYESFSYKVRTTVIWKNLQSIKAIILLKSSLTILFCQRKGNGTGADNIILQATTPPHPPPITFLTLNLTYRQVWGVKMG